MNMFKKIGFMIIILFALFFVVSLGSPLFAQGQPYPQEIFYKAKVEEVTNQNQQILNGITSYSQTVKVKILDGDMKDKEIKIEQGKDSLVKNDQLVKLGETIVIVKILGPDNAPIYQISDRYRINNLVPIILIFFVAIIVLSGWKGIGSILGMAISLAVIVKYIVPQILSGSDPLFTSIVGCLVIMITTIYLAHGFSTKTTVALVSTFLTLVGTGLVSVLFTNITSLTGLGSEDASSLQLGVTSAINFKGLLLGGMLIGTLGVLDDVTTGLSASVFELAKANPTLNFKKLVRAGLEIGKEHISSLVNTLVLAYAGASLPIFIIIVLNPTNIPLWTILNSEMIAEEVVRTLAGSIGLVAAVPLTTLLAGVYAAKLAKKH